MTKILNFALKIKGGGREGGTCQVLRPCHPPKIWNVHQQSVIMVEWCIQVIIIVIIIIFLVNCCRLL